MWLNMFQKGTFVFYSESNKTFACQECLNQKNKHTISYFESYFILRNFIMCIISVTSSIAAMRGNYLSRASGITEFYVTSVDVEPIYCKAAAVAFISLETFAITSIWTLCTLTSSHSYSSPIFKQAINEINFPINIYATLILTSSWFGSNYSTKSTIMDMSELRVNGGDTSRTLILN